MLNKLFSTLNLSEKSRKAVIKSSAFICVFNIAKLLPIVLFAMLLETMLFDYQNGTVSDISIFPYLLFGALILLITYLSYYSAYNYKYIESGEEDYRQRISLAEKIRKLPMSYLGKRDLSDLTSTIMNDVAIVQGVLAQDIAEFLGGIFFGVLTIVALLFYDVKMTIALGICIPFSALAMVICRLVSNNTNKKNHRKKIEVSEGLQEYLENIAVLQSSEQKETYESALSRKIKRLVPGLMLYELLAGFAISAARNFLKTGIGIVIVAGAYLLSSGEITVLKFLTYILISSRLYEPLSFVCDKLGVILFSFVPAGRIRELINHPIQTGSADIEITSHDIEFENVSFAYNDENVLHEVSFTAKQGEITALVGPSGCGKSTLCRLASRFWDVKNGQVLLGGENVNAVDPETLMKNFSFVFQDVVLFNDTIYNNIKIGKEDATYEEVMIAAKLARCDDFIKKLPRGFEETIGENGRTLSGGERQRLSIARAFLKDAPIILLDESTASLDPENETKIQEAIGKLVQNKTVLIIAHRLRSIVDCDKIVVLNKGRIEETGTHAELLAMNGLYHKLYSLQAETVAWSV